MKKIIFSFAVALVTLCSCTEEIGNNLSSKNDANLNISTSLFFDFSPDNVSRQRMSASNNIDSKTVLFPSRDIKLEKWHSFNSENLLEGDWIPLDKDGNINQTQNKRIKTDANCMLEISNLSLGFNSFRAEYVSISDCHDIPLAWQNIRTNSDINIETKYKHYVGITKGTMEKWNLVGNVNRSFNFDFVPLNNNNAVLWGASNIQAVPFEIKNRDLYRTYGDKAVFKKTIVMEMTPKNSVFDLKFKNISKNLYIAVVIRDERTDSDVNKNPDVIQMINPGTSVSRYILNTAKIVAGAKLSCRIYALKKGTKKESDSTNPLNGFEIINGEGSILFNNVIKGNQRYFVKKQVSSGVSKLGDDMEVITLTDNNFTSLGNILVLCHNSLQDNALKWNSWN